MAPAKFALVLAVLLSAALGQLFNQDVMESKHRAVGYRLPPPMYVRQLGPNYNIHHAQHLPSNPIPYTLHRPPGPVHHVRPVHVVPHVHHLPAYQIPYPAPRQTSNYAVPVPPTRTYPVQLASRPYVTPTTPRPAFPSPVHPPRSPHSHPNYVKPQHAAVAPYPPVRPVPTRAPFYPSAPSPLTPKPAPPVGLSLLDLPWVKPLYARNQVPPKPYYYGNPSTWHLQTKEIKPAPVVIKQEDTGVSISSVGSPLPKTVTNTLPSAVANDDIEVREIPREATAFNVAAPVSVATTTQRPINVVISDDSGEDIRVIQVVSTPAPMRTTPPAMIQQIPASDLRVSLAMTTARPATPVVVLDNSDEDVRFIQQELPVPATASVSASAAVPLSIVDDSGEDIRIVQQVQVGNVPVTSPRTPTTTANSLGTNMAEGLGLRNVPQGMSLSPLSVTSSVVSAPQVQTISLVVSDESGEDILRQVPVSNGPVVGPRLTTTLRPEASVVVVDSSDEDVGLGRLSQQGSGPVFSALNAGTMTTQSPRISVSISDNSNEELTIVQRVPISNVAVPTSRSAMTGTSSSFTVVDTSDEDIVLRNVPQEVNRPLSSATRPVVPLNVFDDSVEDLRIVQQVPVPNVSVTPSSTTTRPSASFVILDRSDEDVGLERIRQPTSGPFSSVTNPGRLTQQPAFTSVSILDNSEEDLRIVQRVPVSSVSVSRGPVPVRTSRPTMTGTSSFTVVDTSDEEIVLRNVPQQVNRPLSSASNQVVPAATVFDDSIEDLRIVQQVPVSNVSVSRSPASNVPVPTSRSTATGTSTFTVVVDTSDEDVVLRNIPQEVNRPLLSGSRQVVPATVFDDSVEDLRIVQQVPVSNIPITPPSTTTRPVTSFVVLDRSEEDVLLRDIPQQTISLSSGSASVPTTQTRNRPLVFLDNSAEDVQIVRQGSISNAGTSSLQAVLSNIQGNSLEVPDNSNEDFELRLISQPASVPTLSSPGTPQSTTTPRFLLVDSDEDVQIVQQIILSNNSTSVAETPRIVLRDSAEDFQTNRRVPQPTVSLSGLSAQSAGIAPLLRLVDSAEDIQVTREVSLSSVPLSSPVPATGQTQSSFLVDSAEDIQIVQQIALSNTSSSGTVAETPRIFLRDSAEDFQIDRRIPQPTVSLSGPTQSAGTAPLVRLVDSDEDVQVAREVPLSTVVLSAPVSSTGQTPLSFLVDSEEDTRIVQGNPLSNFSLSGPTSTGAGPVVLLVDSAEDAQQFLRSNVSLSSTTNSRVVLVESAEDIESPVLPLLQAANRVQIQERDLDDDRSDEDIETRVTISGGSIVLVNPTSV
ncbi:hypothetical protein OUZ56_028774 [Daphnia magna]|uniref:Uncharacterized protein n=1 Tax=Daphnia magna TaxID=35525 RepID=A0ABR0B4X5_9CRUS|nr:hypothetical protein OUZ56_028774 [Daphnia magna]